MASLLLCLLLVLVAVANSWTLKKVSAGLTAGLIATSLTGLPTPALSAVGEGGLPDGVLAFQKVIKYQKDWKLLVDALRPRVAEVESKEALNIKTFLKQLANEYYDLEVLSKSISDPAKAKLAMDLAKDFRAQMRANDDAASAGNIQKIVDSYPSTAKDLQDFLDLTSDVPDEI